MRKFITNTLWLFGAMWALVVLIPSLFTIIRGATLYRGLESSEMGAEMSDIVALIMFQLFIYLFALGFLILVAVTIYNWLRSKSRKEKTITPRLEDLADELETLRNEISEVRALVSLPKKTKKSKGKGRSADHR